MAKLKLEELRTKEELINYFKQQGINITEDEIVALKQEYNKVQEIDSNLTMQQLDQVVGGFLLSCGCIKLAYEKTNTALLIIGALFLPLETTLLSMAVCYGIDKIREKNHKNK